MSLPHSRHGNNPASSQTQFNPVLRGNCNVRANTSLPHPPKDERELWAWNGTSPRRFGREIDATREDTPGHAPSKGQTRTPNSSPHGFETENALWVPRRYVVFSKELRKGGPVFDSSFCSLSLHDQAVSREGRRTKKGDGT